MQWVDVDVDCIWTTHLVDDGQFLLLAHLLVYHVHFGRSYHCFSEWNDGFGCGDLNFSKPAKKQDE